MVITLAILVWLLLGAMGTYIGWRFIDNRAYDVGLMDVIVQVFFGGFIFTAAVLIAIGVALSKVKWANIIVLKGK
jgi:hypothetical protein